jgi:hypothetical protein
MERRIVMKMSTPSGADLFAKMKKSFKRIASSQYVTLEEKEADIKQSLISLINKSFLHDNKK